MAIFPNLGACPVVPEDGTGDLSPRPVASENGTGVLSLADGGMKNILLPIFLDFRLNLNKIPNN